ncbi:MAG: DNA recombination protein RmuC [Prevotellaceae bacterium]|jgi:DNA recombination protein RmuC|nr:DNA recombination protein RmuC [Prevotellaceae bacterium]
MATTIIISIIAGGVGFLSAWLWQANKKNIEIAVLESKKITEFSFLEKEKITAVAVLETENKNLTEKLQQQKTEIENLQKRLTVEFENIANRILKERSSEFSFANQKQIGDILNPLKEKIQNFERKVEETYNSETREKAALRQEIKILVELNSKMQTETANLTKALKGDSKMQGDWGEWQLELLLEKTGLQKGVHFVSQPNFKTEDGANVRPDYIVNLPDNKNYVIDSKVSLTAYERYFNADNEQDKAVFLSAHIKSIQQHINDLGGKNYQNLYGINAPDFVFMYFSLEPALYIALQNDSSLFENAFKKNIVLVTNTTLLASMRTVSFIWRQENQKNNVMEIAKIGGQLYDKFVGFTENMIKVGKSMDDAKKVYSDAMNQLVKQNANGSYNAGTIIGLAENLKERGANAAKSLPENLLNRAELMNN